MSTQVTGVVSDDLFALMEDRSIAEGVELATYVGLLAQVGWETLYGVKPRPPHGGRRVTDVSLRRERVRQSHQRLHENG